MKNELNKMKNECNKMKIIKPKIKNHKQALNTAMPEKTYCFPAKSVRNYSQ